MKWEKELNSKLESADTTRHTADSSDSKSEELELQLQKCTLEKNGLEIKMEEAIQDTGWNIHHLLDQFRFYKLVTGIF